METPLRRPEGRDAVVVAGPGSSTTIPGIVVSEIVLALAHDVPVTRIEVDLGLDFTLGLHRAPSLAIAHGQADCANITRHRAPDSARFRAQSLREWIGPEIGTAIAFAWPGIDNSWIKQFVQIAKAAGASTTIACASLPRPDHARAVALADSFWRADLVLVGDDQDAAAMASAFGSSGPKVESHRALAMGGRADRAALHQITAFLPKNSASTLATVLAAFDAIPEAWIDSYHLQIVMRHSDPSLSEMVANSYHAEHVRLIGEDLSTPALEELCASSSVLSIADPTFDSRAFSTAVDSGIATVVLSTSSLPEVGRGYVGGLIADLSHPASVHVALAHALRLAELDFPNPDSWDDLAKRLRGVETNVIPASRLLEPATQG